MSSFNRFSGASRYIADDVLLSDVNAAMALGRPLLVRGEPGTGKTMAAEVIAHTLGLDMYRVDLSSVASRWVGETEKNLKKIGAQFGIRAAGILKENGIKFDPQLLMKYVMSMAPDWRGTLNGLQGKTTDGELDSSILSQSPDSLVEFLKAKRWKDAQEWIFENSYLHPKQLEASLYRALQPQLADASKPQVVLLFASYSDKISSGADPSITLLALATEIMMEAQWKN